MKPNAQLDVRLAARIALVGEHLPSTPNNQTAPRFLTSHVDAENRGAPA